RGECPGTALRGDRNRQSVLVHVAIGRVAELIAEDARSVPRPTQVDVRIVRADTNVVADERVARGGRLPPIEIAVEGRAPAAIAVGGYVGPGTGRIEARVGYVVEYVVRIPSAVVVDDVDPTVGCRVHPREELLAIARLELHGSAPRAQVAAPAAGEPHVRGAAAPVV